MNMQSAERLRARLPSVVSGTEQALVGVIINILVDAPAPQTNDGETDAQNLINFVAERVGDENPAVIYMKNYLSYDKRSSV